MGGFGELVGTRVVGTGVRVGTAVLTCATAAVAGMDVAAAVGCAVCAVVGTAVVGRGAAVVEIAVATVALVATVATLVARAVA